jgi:hypothetical protein
MRAEMAQRVSERSYGTQSREGQPVRGGARGESAATSTDRTREARYSGCVAAI